MPFKYIVTLLLFIPSLIMVGQPERGMPSGPGKCFAKCKNKLDRIDTSYFKLYVLNKEVEKISKKLRLTYFQLESYNEHWIKAYKNSIDEPIWEITSKNDSTKTIEFLPEWYLFKVDPELIDTIYIEIESNPIDELQWIEVVCDTDVTPEMIIDFQDQMYDRGYINTTDPESENSNSKPTFTSELRAVLVQFQIDNNLCYGQLSKETLVKLKE